MQAKRARKGQYLLMPDMTGFLISFNHRHKEAIGEALNLLQELLDEEEEKAVGDMMILCKQRIICFSEKSCARYT